MLKMFIMIWDNFATAFKNKVFKNKISKNVLFDSFPILLIFEFP